MLMFDAVLGHSLFGSENLTVSLAACQSSLVQMDTLYTSVACPLHYKLFIHTQLIEPARDCRVLGVIRLVSSDTCKFAHSCHSCAKCVVSHWTPGIPTCISWDTRWLQVKDTRKSIVGTQFVIALKESHKASVWIAVVGVVNLYLGFDVLSLKFTLVIFRDIFRVAEVWPLTWMLYYFNVTWV